MLKTINKSYAIEVLSDYAEIIAEVPQIIKESGYKVDYIAKRLRLPRSTFYLKRRTRNFSLSEMREIIEMMHESAELEDKYLSERAKIRLADNTNVSREEVMQALTRK